MPEDLAASHETTYPKLDQNEVEELGQRICTGSEADSSDLYGSSVFDASAMSPLSPASAVSPSQNDNSIYSWLVTSVLIRNKESARPTTNILPAIIPHVE
jgi:hypothetical protein